MLNFVIFYLKISIEYFKGLRFEYLSIGMFTNRFYNVLYPSLRPL